jgi:hypothetical protein
MTSFDCFCVKNSSVGRIRPSDDRRIPWTAIPLSGGEKLIVSDIEPKSKSEKQNIGFTNVS